MTAHLPDLEQYVYSGDNLKSDLDSHGEAEPRAALLLLHNGRCPAHDATLLLLRSRLGPEPGAALVLS